MQHVIVAMVLGIISSVHAYETIFADCYYDEHPVLKDINITSTFHASPPFQMLLQADSEVNRNRLVKRIRNETSWNIVATPSSLNISLQHMCDASSAMVNNHVAMLHFLRYTHETFAFPVPRVFDVKNLSHIAVQVEDYEALQLAQQDTDTAWQKTGLRDVLANWEDAPRQHAVGSSGILFDFSLDPDQCISPQACMNCRDSAWQVLEHVFFCDTGTRLCAHRITRGLCVPSSTECPGLQACTACANPATHVRVKRGACVNTLGNADMRTVLELEHVRRAELLSGEYKIWTTDVLQNLDISGWVAWYAWAPWDAATANWMISRRHRQYILAPEHGRLPPPQIPVAAPYTEFTLIVLVLALGAVFLAVKIEFAQEKVAYALVEEEHKKEIQSYLCYQNTPWKPEECKMTYFPYGKKVDWAHSAGPFGLFFGRK